MRFIIQLLDCLKWLLLAATAVAWLLFALTASAADHYVRPTSAGDEDGSDWNNAWSLTGINWASVAAGDTVWLAGGTYTPAGFSFDAHGTSGSRIYVKRSTTNDSACTTAAGWDSGFDAQVAINSTDTAGLFWWNESDNENGSWLWIDGRTDSGIKIKTANGTGSYRAPLYIASLSAIHDTVFTNIDFSGPDDGTDSNFAHLGNNAALTIRAVNPAVSGDPFNTISNLTFAACRFHGAANLVSMAKGLNITWDRCKFYDNVALGTSASVAHQNMFEIIASGYLTFKNCELWNWAVEGLMPYGSALGPIYVYGCLFRDPWLYPQTGSSVARCFEIFTSYKLLAYNNTFVNVSTSVGVWSTASGGAWTSDSEARNNIYWNCTFGSGAPSEDYAFSSGSANGSHSISSGSNPFVNYAGKDYRIVSTNGAKYPADNGVDLGSVYRTDMFGNIRGADGGWDIGALEAGTNTVPATNAMIALSEWRVTPAVAVGSTSNVTVTVTNSGNAVLDWTCSVAAPFSVDKSAGSLATNTTTNVVFTFSPTNVGDYSTAATFTGGGGASLSCLGRSYRVGTWPALATNHYFAGAWSSNASGRITHSSDVSGSAPSYGGLALIGFTVTNAGQYYLTMAAVASSGAANSVWLDVDTEPVGDGQCFDSPVSATESNMIVSWRGSGAYNDPEFDTNIWTLGAGEHLLYVRGREAGFEFRSVAPVALAVTNEVPAPTWLTQPASREFLLGDPAWLECYAQDATGYTWRHEGTNVVDSASIAGQGTASLLIIPSAETNAGSYVVVATNTSGSITSSVAVLTLTNAPAAPTITTAPSGMLIRPGAGATLTVSASGTAPIYYVWYRDGSYAGAGDTLTIESATTVNLGSYTVVAENSSGSVTSAPVSVLWLVVGNVGTLRVGN